MRRAGTWELKSLGDICDFQRGLTYAKGDEVEKSKNIVLRATNVDVGTNLLNLAELRYIRDTFKIPANKKVKKDSLIVCTASGSKSHLGKVAYIDANYDFAFGGFMGLLTPRSGVDSRYLFYRMTSRAYLDFIAALSDGANINNLKFDNLAKFEVPLPPLPEQQRIVGILDEAFEGIAKVRANAEKNLANARELFESELASVFKDPEEGWTRRRLDELGTITSSKRIFKNEYVKEGIPFYRTKEIKQLANQRDITTELFIEDERYLEIKKRFGVPRPGDLLLTAIGTIGEIWVVQGETPFYFKDGNVLWLKDFNGVDSEFLKYILMSFVDGLNSMSRGSAYSALPIHKLSAHEVSLPPLVIQKEIVGKLRALAKGTRELEILTEKKLLTLVELQNSILNRAFAGLLKANT